MTRHRWWAVEQHELLVLNYGLRPERAAPSGGTERDYVPRALYAGRGSPLLELIYIPSALAAAHCY